MEFAGDGVHSQGAVDVALGCWMGDLSAWLHAYGPVVSSIMVDRTSYQRVTKDRPYIEYDANLANDGERTDAYGAHAVVIVGYNSPEHPVHPDTFTIMNSLGTDWGDGGFAYIKVPTARKCFRDSYGLLFREQLGYTWKGRVGTQATSNIVSGDW